MKYAVIDIGSNTIRLSFFQRSIDDKVSEFLNKKSTAGLQSYVLNGYLTKNGIEKLVRILKKFIQIANSIDIYEINIFATAVLRNIKNRDDVLDFVSKEIDNHIDLISGTEEALFGYYGITQEYDISNGILIDIGGGSTEITKIEKDKIVSESSIQMGSLSLFNKFCKKIIPRKKEYKMIDEYVSYRLKKVELKTNCKILYGTGGTVRAVGNICQELNQLSSQKEIAVEFVESLYDKIKSKDKKTINTILQVSPDRVHTLPTGIVILLNIMRKAGSKYLYISKNGVREGYLINKLKEQNYDK